MRMRAETRVLAAECASNINEMTQAYSMAKAAGVDLSTVVYKAFYTV